MVKVGGVLLWRLMISIVTRKMDYVKRKVDETCTLNRCLPYFCTTTCQELEHLQTEQLYPGQL